MGIRKQKREREEMRRQARLRFDKDKTRNVLARPGLHDVVLILDNLKSGFNVPKIFRSGETFSVREIHLINIEPFDPAPAKGALRKVPARWHDNFASSYTELKQHGYTFFTLEADCCNNLINTSLPQKSAFIFGNEGLGICFNKQDYPDIQCLSIPQFGSTESLNVSVAASIVLYEYVRQHSKL